jgi:general stress protein YciG
MLASVPAILFADPDRVDEAVSEEPPKQRRGFALFSASRRSQVASMGGKAAHARGRAHKFTPDEARLAGKKGGHSVSRDRHHMSEIGRRGGQSRHHSEESGPVSGPPELGSVEPVECR